MLQPGRGTCQPYSQPPHSQLGYLLAVQPAPQHSKQQQQDQRRRTLSKLVQRRWQTVAEEREAQRAAAALHRHLLFRRVLAALNVALAASRAKALRADQQLQKWAYLRASGCWAAWRDVASRRRRMAALVAEAAELRRCTLAARALAVLQHNVEAQRAKRRALATANSFRCFCLMVHALDAWRGAIQTRVDKRQLLAVAVLHWAARLCRRALAAWREYARHRLRRWGHLQLAQEHRRLHVLGSFLAAWATSVRCLNELRQAASTTIQQALYGSAQQLAGMCLLGWRQYADRQARLRDAAHLAGRLRHFGLLSAALRSWQLWYGWQQHLRRLHTSLLKLQPRFVLVVAVRRWQQAVWAAQADDAGLCYRAVQLPRVFGAWRQEAHLRSELRSRGEVCARQLACHQQRRVLVAWSCWAAGKLAARARLQEAAARCEERRRRAALAEWRAFTQRKAARKEQRQQAEAHFAARLCGAALRRWRRLAGVRQASGRCRDLYLLRLAFGSWRQRTAGKALEQARWRLAVRQHYLRRLWSGLEAWRRHHQWQQQKEQRLQAMRQHCQAVLLRCCLSAWAGPFLAAARKQRAKAQAADAFHSSRLLQQVLAAWQGPFLAAARQRRPLLVVAERFRREALLLKAWRAWKVHGERQEQKRQRVAAAQERLQASRLRCVLAAWQSRQQELALQRRQAAAADAVLRKRQLCRAWLAWQEHVEWRQHKHSRWCAALLFSGRRAARQALTTWRAAAHTAVLLRRLGQGEAAAAGVEAVAPAETVVASQRQAAKDRTTLLLNRLRQLRCAAVEAAASGLPAFGAADRPLSAEVQPAPQWRAASIGNLPPTPGAGAAGEAFCSDRVQASWSGCSSAVSSTGSGSRAPRAHPRLPAWYGGAHGGSSGVGASTSASTAVKTQLVT